MNIAWSVSFDSPLCDNDQIQSDTPELPIRYFELRLDIPNAIL